MRAGASGDLSADPYEQRDIASMHPELAQTMQHELENWQRSVELSLSGQDYPTTATPSTIP